MNSLTINDITYADNYDDNEPLLKLNKYNVFTKIYYPELEAAAEAQENARWFAHEIQLTDDARNWKTLSENEQRFIKHVLSFSAVSDGLVNANLLERFLKDVTDPSARRFYLFQAVMEEVHARTYGLMLSAVVSDTDELARLMSPDVNIPSINMKIQWIEKWINSDAPFGQRVVAFIIVEGLFFSSLFCSFYWIKHRGSKLPGMIQANEFIARDEGLHCQFAAKLLQYVVNKPSMTTVERMMREAVKIEHNFVNDSLPVGLLGMNSKLMCDYVEYVADRTLQMICVESNESNTSHYMPKYCVPIYNTKNPFDWIESISLMVQANFFERRPTDYQDSRAGRSCAENSFSYNAEF